MKLGEPLPVRLELIRQLSADRTRPVQQIRFKGQLEQCAIHRVSLDFPKYRINNGRTQAAQIALLAQDDSLPRDLFARDQESEEVQRAQHNILRKMLGNSPNLIDFFKKNEQEQPFVLNHLGFIINGNRRIAALRELVAKEPEFSTKFANIDVIFLPPGTEKDWDELEAKYQIVEDIQLSYSWTATAVMIRSRRDEHRYKTEELMSLYKMSKGEVEELIDMLSLAEEYLVTRGKPKQYDLVDKDEFAFRQLRKNRAKLSGGEARKDAFQLLSYLLIDEAPEGSEETGRVYAAIPRLAKHFDAVSAAVDAQLPKEGLEEDDQPGVGDLSLLGIETTPASSLMTRLRQTNDTSSLREVVVEKIVSEELRTREVNREKRSLNSLRRAQEDLQDVLASWVDGSKSDRMPDLLTSIEALVQRIRDKVNAHPGD